MSGGKQHESVAQHTRGHDPAKSGTKGGVAAGAPLQTHDPSKGGKGAHPPKQPEKGGKGGHHEAKHRQKPQGGGGLLPSKRGAHTAGYRVDETVKEAARGLRRERENDDEGSDTWNEGGHDEEDYDEGQHDDDLAGNHDDDQAGDQDANQAGGQNDGHAGNQGGDNGGGQGNGHRSGGNAKGGPDYSRLERAAMAALNHQTNVGHFALAQVSEDTKIKFHLLAQLRKFITMDPQRTEVSQGFINCYRQVAGIDPTQIGTDDEYDLEIVDSLRPFFARMEKGDRQVLCDVVRQGASKLPPLPSPFPRVRWEALRKAAVEIVIAHELVSRSDLDAGVARTYLSSTIEQLDTGSAPLGLYKKK